MDGALPSCSMSAPAAEEITTWLVTHIAHRLDMPPEALDCEQSLLRYGLDSLAAMELVADLEDWLECSLPMTLLWEYPTITAIAAYLAATVRAIATLPDIAPAETVQSQPTSFPLSHGQRALWLLQQQAPDNPAYNIACALRITGAFAVPALHTALQQLLERHAAFRTTFPLVHGEPTQRVQNSAQVVCHLEDATHWSEEQVQAYLTTEAHRPFALERDALWRVSLLRRAEHEHVLLMVMHHIITDFWSFEVLVHELGVLYQAAQQGETAELAPQSQQYADYVRWQAAWLTAQDNAEAYWVQQLAGADPVLHLPTDRPRPALQTWHGHAVTGRLSPQLTAQLKALSQAQGSTLYSALLSAFAVLLHRYAGQDDLLIGSPMACRSQSAWAGILGYFANPVVLRGRLHGNPSFSTFLAQMQQTVLGGLEHQHYPFPVLVERLQPERDPSRTPLFQVMFVLQQARPLNDRTLAALALGNTAVQFELAGLAMDLIPLPQQATQCDITLHMAEVDGCLLTSLQYNTDLFEATRMTRFLGHFETLLAGIVADPQTPIGALPLLTPAEQQCLQAWNATQVSYPLEQSLQQHIEAQVARTPTQVAVTFGDTQLTYAELNHKANQLAHYLRRLGVGPDVLVGVCLERSLEMVVGLLGILKAGGAYVPLDPTYPAERLTFMLADAQAPVLLTQAHLVGRLSSQAAQVCCLDSDWPSIAQESPENPVTCTLPEHLAYVIYTSGSTGQPKGAMNTHQGICNRLLWMQETYQLTTTDAVLQKTPCSFDVSVWEFFWPLMTGARLVVARPGGHLDSAYLARLIAAEQITVLHFVPSMLQVFLDTQGLEHCVSLRHVVCSGEALSVRLQERFFTRLGHAALHNLYGPTEAAVDVTFWACTPEGPPQTVPIGRPIANTQIYLLDAYLQPVPVGVPAELHIGGVGLARGYLKRPELTASKFIAHPYSPEPLARLYKTGDLAQYRADGTIEYLGRLDQQVKLHGFRLELGEIEATLCHHPEVREAVVMLREETPGEPNLVAYVVAQSSQSPSRQALRTFLQTYLPTPMIPTSLVFLDAMPLSPNGKLARQLLPAPSQHRQRATSAYVAPRTPVESLLANIWGQVLGVEQVGVLDNFFDLGGDSMRSLRICAEAQRAGIQLTIQELYQQQTIAALAQTSAMATASTTLVEPLRPFALLTDADRTHLPPGVVDAYPLAALQAGMLFHSAWDTHTTTYHDVFSFHLRIAFDAKAMQQAAQQLAMRHPILRTAFAVTGYSVPVQLVYADVPVPVQILDWRHHTQAEQERLLAAWREDEKRCGFDWRSAPLWRLFVHRRSAASLQYTLSFHHAILDGWSVAALLTEFFTLYLAYCQEESVDLLPPLSTVYRDFVANEQQILQSQAAQAYWHEQLAEAPRTPLPYRPDLSPDTSLPETRLMTLPLPAALTELLRRLAQDAGAPLRSVLLAAHLRVLSLLSGHTDVLTGVVMHNRPATLDSERTLGLFLNTLPFRMQLSAGTWHELVQHTFNTEQGHTPFRQYPLGAVQRQQGGQALFQTVFDYTHFHIYQQLTEQHALTVLDHAIFEQTNFPLYIRFMHDIADTTLSLHVHYDASQYSDTYVCTLVDFYHSVLQAMAQQPSASHAQQCLLPAAQQQSLLNTWNATQADYPDTQCLHELFEAQVERTPEAIALVCGEEQLTFQALNQRANQLAHYLQRHGVGPDMPVGLYVERSLAMIVGIFGVLKAGGAYLPLDPTYPPERLRFMLEDAQPAVLVTQAPLVSQMPLPGVQTTVVCLDTDWAAIAQESATNPECETTPDHLAYVIYTSGSTGQPKGVQGLHRGAVNRCAWMWQAYPYRATDVGCQKTSLNFVDSVWEIFGPLLQGVRLVLFPNEVVRDPQRLVDTLAQHAVSRLVLVPSLLRLLLDTCTDLQARLPHLSLWISSGEVLPLTLARRFQQCLPDRLLLNLYGSSEVAADVTYYDTRQLSPQQTRVPIGRPLANTQLYLLDAHLQPVPLGAPGELYVGGAGLARGYLNRPDLTAERFITLRLGSAPLRLYKTGDMARYLPDGTLEYLGRLDQQVKLRGIRIELGEISTTLEQHPDIRQALAMVREDHHGDARLVAYVVPHQAVSPSSHELRSFLQKKLPEYMVPTTLVPLEQLPLTPNGKVDWHALPTTAVSPTPDTSYQAPATSLEHTLVAMWAALLGVSRIGRHESFFDLGGHSLLAMQLMAQIQETLGCRVPLGAWLPTPTLAALAAVVTGTVHGTTLLPLQSSGTGTPLFCLPPAGGQALGYRLLAEQLGTERPIYALQACPETVTSSHSLAALASLYTTVIRQQQPEGPYLLLGWSFGGVLALAVAQCLEQQGQQVALVGLIDTFFPQGTSHATDALWSLALACGSALSSALYQLDLPAQQALRTALLPLAPPARLEALLRWGQAHGIPRHEASPELVLQQARLIHNDLRLLRSHTVQALHAPIYAWWASAGFSTHVQRPQWEHYTCGRISMAVVAGNHWSVLQAPAVEALAASVQEALHTLTPTPDTATEASWLPSRALTGF